MEQLKRLEILIGDKINLLKDITILVIGLGGVGGYAIETLARSGIGNFILVDNDCIDITNLNRQIISNHENIGNLKVDEWEKRLKTINPSINIKKINEFITKENIQMLFNEKIDYLIDACDTIETKKLLIKYCLKSHIKFISCMGTGKKFHPELLEVTDIRKTSYDPLAKIIRKMVKDEKIKDKIPVVCSKEVIKKSSSKQIGSTSFVPSVAGILCASYIFNMLIEDDLND